MKTKNLILMLVTNILSSSNKPEFSKLKTSIGKDHLAVVFSGAEIKTNQVIQERGRSECPNNNLIKKSGSTTDFGIENILGLKVEDRAECPNKNSIKKSGSTTDFSIENILGLKEKGSRCGSNDHYPDPGHEHVRSKAQQESTLAPEAVYSQLSPPLLTSSPSKSDQTHQNHHSDPDQLRSQCTPSTAQGAIKRTQVSNAENDQNSPSSKKQRPSEIVYVPSVSLAQPASQPEQEAVSRFKLDVSEVSPPSIPTEFSAFTRVSGVSNSNHKESPTARFPETQKGAEIHPAVYGTALDLKLSPTRSQAKPRLSSPQTPNNPPPGPALTTTRVLNGDVNIFLTQRVPLQILVGSPLTHTLDQPISLRSFPKVSQSSEGIRRERKALENDSPNMYRVFLYGYDLRNSFYNKTLLENLRGKRKFDEETMAKLNDLKDLGASQNPSGLFYKSKFVLFVFEINPLEEESSLELRKLAGFVRDFSQWRGGIGMAGLKGDLESYEAFCTGEGSSEICVAGHCLERLPQQYRVVSYLVFEYSGVLADITWKEDPFHEHGVLDIRSETLSLKVEEEVCIKRKMKLKRFTVAAHNIHNNPRTTLGTKGKMLPRGFISSNAICFDLELVFENNV